jgi:hypothetical protein
MIDVVWNGCSPDKPDQSTCSRISHLKRAARATPAGSGVEWQRRRIRYGWHGSQLCNSNLIAPRPLRAFPLMNDGETASPEAPRLMWASYGYANWPRYPIPFREGVAYLVLCARCELVPGDAAGEGVVRCDLVHARTFATFEEAAAYESVVHSSLAIWSYKRREPQDVRCVFVITADDPNAVNQALLRVSKDLELRRLLRIVSERWISGTNPYRTTLAAARAFPSDDVVASLEGDDGGSIYLICPVRLIRCDEATLRQLLVDIDAIEWPGQRISGARIAFDRADVALRLDSTMGGGLITADISIHVRLRQKGLEAGIKAVLEGERARLV